MTGGQGDRRTGGQDDLVTLSPCHPVIRHPVTEGFLQMLLYIVRRVIMLIPILFLISIALELLNQMVSVFLFGWTYETFGPLFYVSCSFLCLMWL